MQLLLISLLFLIAERLMPWRSEQTLLRRGSFNDVLHFLFNGYLFYLGYAVVVAQISAGFTDLIRGTGAAAFLDTRLLTGQPMALQFPVLFLAQDLMMWVTHNLLHRIPFLWSIHKVHHSIEDMDWIGNMRYHWGEIIVYQLVLFVPITVLGADSSLHLYIGIINTVIGHFNHSNIDVDLGRLRYVFNSPRMHVWHHARTGPGPLGRNFAIGLSLWDWIFRTAYYPAKGEPEQPESLGFEEQEEYPRSFVGQQLYPLSRAWKGRRLYAVVPLLLALSAVASAQQKGITIDTAARSVTFSGTIHPGRFNGANSSLNDHHFIVWRKGGAAGNALILSDANDLDVQRALQSLGAVAGENLTLDTWEKRADLSHRDPDLAVKGSGIDVRVAWGGHAPVGASDILVDKGGKGFRFRLGGHERHIATWRSGCVVCLESCPGGRISNAAYTMRDLYNGRAKFTVRKELLPADGTPVTITMTLARGPAK